MDRELEALASISLTATMLQQRADFASRYAREALVEGDLWMARQMQHVSTRYSARARWWLDQALEWAAKDGA